MLGLSDISNEKLALDAKHLKLIEKIVPHQRVKNSFSAINPANGKVLCLIDEYGHEETDAVVQTAKHAFQQGSWALMPSEERKKRLLKFATLIKKHAYELAFLDTIEMGIPFQFSMNMNIQGAINCLRWYAECVDKLYEKIAPTHHNALTLITREPIGVVAAIVAWNVPLLVAMTKVAPALIGGNSVILKPAEQSSLSAIKLAEIALEADIPPGVFSVITGRGEVTGKALASHPDVGCITFTGSTETAKQILKYISQSTLKRICMECGGKSPNIIFADYDQHQKAVKS